MLILKREAASTVSLFVCDECATELQLNTGFTAHRRLDDPDDIAQLYHFCGGDCFKDSKHLKGALISIEPIGQYIDRITVKVKT